MSMMRSSVSIPEMIQQSRDVMTNPAVATFERYERQGTMANAAIYVAVGAVIAGVLGFVVGMLPGPPGAMQQLLSNLIAGPISFFAFTGLVYFLGQAIAGGTGSFDEVTYTFALFSVPLTIIGAVLALVFGLLGLIPILNILTTFIYILISILILIVQVYFGYLSVQSSMNIHDQTKAILTLVLAAVGSFIVLAVVGSVFVAFG